MDDERRLELLRDGEEAEAQEQAAHEAEGMTPLEIDMRRDIDRAFDRALGDDPR